MSQTVPRALVSVVVPIYNVGGYLADCLDSIAGQTYPELEVLLIDDGSTDDSGRIAARYARVDRRFRLIRQENRGLGAARNTGIAAGTGGFLAFVDSDDLLPPYALEVLVGALRQAGSDFASGNVALFTARGLRQSPLHRGTHRVTRLGVSLAAAPNLLYDRLACNKVFRRSFWTRHDLRFPEGVRYEDIPVTIPASALARAIDVIDLPVYYWRQRESGTDPSISQRQGEVGNLVDRFAAVTSASRSLAAHADAGLKNRYDEIALRSDLRMFLDLLPDVDDDYRHRFLDLAGDFLSVVDDRVLDRLVPRLRVAWWLARHRALPELLDVVSAGRHGATPPAVRRGLGHYLQLPLLDVGHSAAPRRLFRLPGGIRTEVHEVRWTGDRLRVRGLAYDAVRGATRPWAVGRLLWLRAESGQRRRILPLPAAAHRIAQLPSSVPYGWAGFSVLLDPRRLRGRRGWGIGDWSFNVAVLGAGRPQWRRLGMGEPRPALPARWVADGVRVVPYVRGGGLWLRVQRPYAWVTGVRIVEGALLVDGVAVDRPAGAGLWLTRVPGVLWRHYPVCPVGDGTGWTARIPLADLVAGAALATRPVLVGEAGAGWRVAFAAPGLAPGRLPAPAPDPLPAPAPDSLPDSLPDPLSDPALGDVLLELPVAANFSGLRHLVGGVELFARPADDGVLWLRVLPPGPVVFGADLADGVLSLTGKLPAGGADWSKLRIVLRRWVGVEPADGPPPDIQVPTEVAGGRWAARIWLTAEATAAVVAWAASGVGAGSGAVRTGPAALPNNPVPSDGDWSPLYRQYPAAPPIDLVFDASARRLLPRDVDLGGRRLELISDREREVLRLGPAVGQRPSAGAS